MILRAVKWTRYAWRTAVYGCVGRRADVEFGKLVELDIDFVLGATLTLGFHFSCL